MDYNKVIEDLVDQAKVALKLGDMRTIGLDIGLSAVKIAEVEEKNGAYEIKRYASVALPEGALIEDEIQKDEEIIDAIVACFKKAGITNKQVCLGLSGPNTVTRKLQLAGGTDEEIEDQVTWEAEQYLPFGLDESKLSFHIIGENEGGGVDVVIAAAHDNVVESFVAIANQSGLKVKIIDLDVIALANMFELCSNVDLDDPASSWLVIDFGAQKTELLIYKNHTIVFTKEMPIGGSMITEEIQRQLGVNHKEAEDLKIVGDSNGNLPEEIVAIMDDVVEAFFSEIKKTIDFYISSTSDESMVSCFVTGGASQITGLVEGLQGLLNMEIEILDPTVGMSLGKGLGGKVVEDLKVRGIAALGLAMRSLE